MKPFANALAVAALAVFVTRINAQVMYTVTDIGLLPGELATAGWDVNNAGQVVGQAPGISTPHNFFWSVSTGMIDLGTFDQIRPRYVGINNSGQIAQIMALGDWRLAAQFGELYPEASSISAYCRAARFRWLGESMTADRLSVRPIRRPDSWSLFALLRTAV